MAKWVFPKLKMRIIKKILFFVILLGGVVPGFFYLSSRWYTAKLNLAYISQLSLNDLRLYASDLNIDHSSEAKGLLQSMESRFGDKNSSPNRHVLGDPKTHITNATAIKSSKISVNSYVEQQNSLKASSSVNNNVSNITLDAPKATSAITNTNTTTERRGERCPDKIQGLVGRITINKTEVSEAELNRKYQSLNRMGHFKPENCRSENKTAIIIPFRSRKRHLLVLVNNLIPFLIKQQVEFSIFVVEPTPEVTFNRALLLNIGFVEALKLDNFTCFIFHDVDLLPENDNNLYRCSAHPRHVAISNSKFKHRLPYQDYAGGVISFSKEQYINVNGHSNMYFGWGAEDDDLFNRLHSKGYKLLRYPMEIGRYFALSHGKDQGNSDNEHRIAIIRVWKERMKTDGLNSLKYTVKQLKFKNIFIWIYVDINWSFYKNITVH